jgi:hypothetical protein
MAKAKANQNTSLLSWYYIAKKICTGEFSHSSLVFILETIMAMVEEWCRKDPLHYAPSELPMRLT